VGAFTVDFRFTSLAIGKTFQGSGGVIVFYMFGKFWLSNKKRNRMYRMNDASWHIIKLSTFSKLLMIIRGTVKAPKCQSRDLSE